MKSSKSLGGLLALCLVTANALAADALWGTPQAYLGESPPDDTPRPFAVGRLAEPGMFTAGRSAFSRDGREFYFSQNDSWESGEHAKLRMMRFADGKWGVPTTLATQSFSPTLSMDEKTLYMRKGGMRNLWTAHRSGDSWSAPASFLERQQGLYDFIPTLSGTYYVAGEPDEADKARGSTYVIGVISLGGKEPQFRSLGAPINGSGFNGDFFVAPDESYMVLSANISPTFESEAHIAFRKPDGSWTKPVSLGDKINHDKAHRWVLLRTRRRRLSILLARHQREGLRAALGAFQGDARAAAPRGAGRGEGPMNAHQRRYQYYGDAGQPRPRLLGNEECPHLAFSGWRRPG